MSNDWVYTDKVQKHFMEPKNILEGSEDNMDFNGKGSVGSPACGDMMVVYLKIEDDKIMDFKWKTYGCASAIASTSMLSEMVTKEGGMSLDEAYKITPEKIIKELGGLPSNKIHCSVLGDKALRAAIDNYYENVGEKNPYKEKPSKTICHCMDITDDDIRMEVLEGAKDYHELQKRTKIGTVCGKCEKEAKEVIRKYVDKYYSDTTYNPESN